MFCCLVVYVFREGTGNNSFNSLVKNEIMKNKKTIFMPLVTGISCFIPFFLFSL
jgi:hypothetical protein